MMKRTFFYLPVLAMLAVLLVPALAQAETHYISSEADMISFANSVNGGDNYLGDTLELTRSITLSGNWRPLSGFEGTFDGKGYQIEYNISGNNDVGLFSSISINGTVKNLRVKASVSGYIIAGGIAVYNQGNIENCSFEGSVDCTYYAGGLAGVNHGTISNCFNKGTVSATYAGGLASYSDHGTFINSYNTGTVNGTGTDALAGICYFSSLNRVFWLDTSCAAVIGDDAIGNSIQNVERFYSSGNLYTPVVGQTTLLDALNDHTDIWAIYDNGYNYPVLRTIAASPSILDFGSAETGYELPSMQTVTIENAGEHPLTLNAFAASSHFAYGTLSSQTLAAGASVPLTVQPKAGLLPGAYAETLAISDSEGRTVNVTVSFTVNTATIGAAQIGGIEAPQTGAVPVLTGSLIDGDARYMVTNLTWQNGDGSPATLVNGRFMADSSYQAVIELTAAAGCKFPSGGITPSVNTGTPQAGTIAGGDAEENSLTFLVTFPDTEALAITGIAVKSQPANLNYIEGEALSLAGLVATLTYNDATTLDVSFAQFDEKGILATPADGTLLSVSSHNGQRIALSCAGYEAYTNPLTVTPVLTYAITASPATIAFDNLAEGYLQPEATTITVTNTGNQGIALYQPTSAHYVIGTLSETALATGAAAAFTIQPKADLSVGTYNETIHILGSMGANDQVEVTFACTVLSDDYIILSGDGGTYQQDGSGPPSLSFTANGSIQNFTGLTLNGQLVDEDDYDVYEGSTIVVLHQDFLDTLLPGTYTLRFHYTDGQTQANFVVQDTMPVTGDNDALPIFSALTLLCLATLWLIRKKKADKET